MVHAVSLRKALTQGPCASGARLPPLPGAALTSAGAGLAAGPSPWGTGWTLSEWAATGTILLLVVTPLWGWCCE